MSSTHDYTNNKRRWGQAIHYRPVDSIGERLSAGGWGRGIKQGDFILLTNPAGLAETRYQVESIDYYSNPGDQWHGVLVFAPRQTEASA